MNKTLITLYDASSTIKTDQKALKFPTESPMKNKKYSYGDGDDDNLICLGASNAQLRQLSLCRCVKVGKESGKKHK